MRVFVAFLIGLTSTVGLAAEGQGTSMSVTMTDKQQVTLSGHSDASHEVVLQIAKSKHTKQLEWTSQIEGEFTAQLIATNNISLGEGKVGKGLEFKVQTQNRTQEVRPRTSVLVFRSRTARLCSLCTEMAAR